ncbi:hypothetical protein AMAG_04530 [Allomyces macrogynus ATCC 38327]|uniref:Uncharacterized protein n=1 Tax=Allomyces macrogynus (strain ATCC 38327) TaxID=578462 RepID=A0A0L0S5M7_ALLM3|nr:hypothetical protein AMAG_04530 [Allomyces macrogynus ATCC 38327]|eukprot:KNE57669.1 hypothetical protein AMAG_04530 [Allomyces macrogynus ATCC 38327]
MFGYNPPANAQQQAAAANRPADPANPDANLAAAGAPLFSAGGTVPTVTHPGGPDRAIEAMLNEVFTAPPPPPPPASVAPAHGHHHHHHHHHHHQQRGSKAEFGYPEPPSSSRAQRDRDYPAFPVHDPRAGAVPTAGARGLTALHRPDTSSTAVHPGTTTTISTTTTKLPAAAPVAAVPGPLTPLTPRVVGTDVVYCLPTPNEQLHVPFSPEVCYVTNASGDFVSIEDKTWNDFIQANCASPLVPAHARLLSPAILGKSLFEFIADAKLQRFTRHILSVMKMTVCRLLAMHGEPLILWTSAILYERAHLVPAQYLAFPGTTSADRPSTADTDGKKKRKTRLACSYCKRILVYLAELAHHEIHAVLAAPFRVSDTNPIFEDNGVVPVIGLRGKMGMQMPMSPAPSASSSSRGSGTDRTGGSGRGDSPVRPAAPPTVDITMGPVASEYRMGASSSTHVWLTPVQYYRHTTVGDRDHADARTPGIQLQHTVCEVCYQEILKFFLPMYAV